jgi:hypothetical protein
MNFFVLECQLFAWLHVYVVLLSSWYTLTKQSLHRHSSCSGVTIFIVDLVEEK